MLSKSVRCFLFGVVIAAVCTPSAAIGPANVLVLYNSSSPESYQIATSYAGVYPGVQVLGLEHVPTAEEVSEDVYLNLIRPQVMETLDTSIDCIVTTKGLPLRIRNEHPGDASATNVYSSLESELTRIDTINSAALMGNQQYMLPEFMGGNSLALNPYCGKDRPFSYQVDRIRLTSRLDGFTAADIHAAVVRGRNAIVGLQEQRFVLDDDPDAPASAADNIADVDTLLTQRGFNSVYNGDNDFVADVPGTVLGYCSHGSYSGGAGYLSDEVNGIQFDMAPGAIFHSWESYNAYSFNPGGNHYGQGLIAEWIARGGAAGVGHVEEPGANQVGVAHEPTLFESMLDGLTWVESAWNATMQLSFVNTVVGDPLMRWRPPPMAGDSDMDGDVDVSDLGNMANGFGLTDALWTDGDFTGDGIVDVFDLMELADNYGATAPAPVPEPATAALLGAAALATLRRRRKAG